MRRRERVCFAVCTLIVLLTVYGYLSFSPRCLFTHIVFQVFSKAEPHDQSDVTIITAFLDLGSFRKGKSLVYTPQHYMEWAETYKYLANPLIVYTDSTAFQQWFLSVRTGIENRTSIIRLNRTNVPSFQRIDKVVRVFSDPNYPKFYPNTVLPEYACSQHAKVDFVAMSIRENPFATKYFAWLDIGYFRYTTFRKRKFWIVVPPEMDDNKMAVNEIESPDFSIHPETIFKSNKVWVGGGMVLAAGSTYLRYIEEYRRALDYFLQRGLFNTDQQVMYSMFTDLGRKTLNVMSKLQTYASWHRDCWFYLGYLCYKEE
ncbi:hypothetical protein BaRGS_00006094 [Batillaria attramentaria]|uniref:Uncharacterized protein n=1 Tax=Batillaria attramentaria TaxID=370345 RepID=A0ABD0LSG6_9CAEN